MSERRLALAAVALGAIFFMLSMLRLRHVGTFPVDNYSQAVFSAETSGYTGLIVRVNRTNYMARILSGEISLVKFSSGDTTLMKTEADCGGAAVTDGDVVRLEAVRDTIRVLKNGSAVSGCVVRDSNYTSGYPKWNGASQ